MWLLRTKENTAPPAGTQARGTYGPPPRHMAPGWRQTKGASGGWTPPRARTTVPRPEEDIRGLSMVQES